LLQPVCHRRITSKLIHSRLACVNLEETGKWFYFAVMYIPLICFQCHHTAGWKLGRLSNLFIIPEYLNVSIGRHGLIHVANNPVLHVCISSINVLSTAYQVFNSSRYEYTCRAVFCNNCLISNKFFHWQADRQSHKTIPSFVMLLLMRRSIR